MTTEILIDNPQTTAKQVWSVPFSGSAKELISQSHGNLVVRDTNDKVFWASNVSAPYGRLFMLNPSGKIQILMAHRGYFIGNEVRKRVTDLFSRRIDLVRQELNNIGFLVSTLKVSLPEE